MKRVLAVMMALGIASSATAGVKFTPLEWFSPNYQFQLRIGACWYHDHRPTDREVNISLPVINDIGAYIQTPLVEWDKAYISAGYVFPFNYTERSRPEFSLDTRVGYWWKDCPTWLDFEIGAYVAVSPYNASGVQVGFLNLRF
jgi:hypothetical protein